MEREKEKKKEVEKSATWKISFMPVGSRGPCTVMWCINCAMRDYIIMLVHKPRRIGYNAGWSAYGLWLVRFCHLPSPAAGELRLLFFFFSRSQSSILYSPILLCCNWSWKTTGACSESPVLLILCGGRLDWPVSGIFFLKYFDQQYQFSALCLRSQVWSGLFLVSARLVEGFILLNVSVWFLAKYLYN